jgi:acyl carrier protein
MLTTMANPMQSIQTNEIEREVRDFLVMHFLSGRAEKLRDDGSLLGDVIDSTGVIELVGYLQDRFKITIDDEEVIPANLETIKSLAAFVARKLDAEV